MRYLLSTICLVLFAFTSFGQLYTECKYASFSPDGNYIIYQTNQMGSWNIAAIRLDTPNVYPLTMDQSDNMHPCWSPDGKSFAYTTNKDGGNYEIYVRKFLSFEETNLSMNEASDQYPSWSHNGELIAFSSDRVEKKMNIFTVMPNGEDLKMITEGAFDEIRPIWSPNDSKLAYTFKAFDRLNPAYVNLKKGNEQKQYLLWNHSTYVSDWDSKGNSMYISSDHGPRGGDNIYTFDLNIKITDFPTTVIEKCSSCVDASLSPDGVHIVFSKRDKDGLSLYMMKADGTEIQKLNTSFR